MWNLFGSFTEPFKYDDDDDDDDDDDVVKYIRSSQPMCLSTCFSASGPEYRSSSSTTRSTSCGPIFTPLRHDNKIATLVLEITGADEDFKLGT